MRHYRKTEERVLAIDPICRGFGFVIFEGPELLVDWGVVNVRQDKHAQCLNRITRLIERYDPQVIVLEDTNGKNSRRCERVETLLSGIAQLAIEKGIRTQVIARSLVKKVFATYEASNKEKIAGILSAKHPELLQHLPPHRKCWMTEDTRTSIFDAAALGYVFFQYQG